MNLWRTLKNPPWRTVVPACVFLLALGAAWLLWRPGLDVRDGRDDRGHNAIWLDHGWFGADAWFLQNGKSNLLSRYHDPSRIAELADHLRRNHITDVFPHLCPAEPNGRLPAVDPLQVERFLDAFHDFRVLPWIGGPNGASVRLNSPAWRAAFATNVLELIRNHPRLAGVQLNIEPLPSGDKNFLDLVEELHRSLPPGKLISVAANPPPTWWHQFPDVHWDESYFREVARRSDQMAVMMYDVGQGIPKTYQSLMADWTSESLAWSESKPILLGVPTYSDSGVDYHNPKVENLTNALLGIHRGLSGRPLPASYQGIAIYCEWETGDSDWNYLRNHFLSHSDTTK